MPEKSLGDTKNLETIEIPIALHIVDDGTVQYTSTRDTNNIQDLIDKANQLWEQANIQFTIEKIDVVTIENKDFSKVFSGEVAGVTQRDDFVEGRINGYFANYINANGVAFPPQGLFVIADVTTVNDFRTTAHELGHLLGLHHTTARTDLMFKGSNGEFLSEDEITTARRNALRVYAR